MKTCTSNVHYMFYSNNDPLPLKEFESDHIKTECKQCRKCREYKNNREKRYRDNQDIGYHTIYDNACNYCIQPDCIRDSLSPRHDARYLNRCMFAVARKFDIRGGYENIPASKIIKWQSFKEYPIFLGIIEDGPILLRDISKKTGYALATVRQYIHQYQKDGYIERKGQIILLSPKGFSAVRS